MHPTSEELRKLDQRHVWHPFTPHSTYAEDGPLMVVDAEGHWLVDANGKRYLDGVASLWCNFFGHRNPTIDKAVRDQLDHFAHATFLGNASAPAVQLAGRLIDVAPNGLSRVFFSDNGSSATEVAAKMAFQFWQQGPDHANRKRTKFVTLSNAYHGDTIGAVSLGGIDLFHRVYGPLLFETIQIPSPYCYRCPLGLERSSCGVACIDTAERIIAEHADEIAAVMIEPGVQGAGGMITQPDGYVRRVREATRNAGAFFIADEVAVGCGRSGKRFASDLEEIAPDFLCLAKGLTGGYLPLSATLTTERVFEGFLGKPEEGRTFYHGHTFTGNALGAAAAHASLDLLADILPTLPETVAHFAARADRLKVLPAVGDVRRYGLALGVELVANRDLKTAFPAELRIGMQVCKEAGERGVFLRPIGDTIMVMPALNMSGTDLDLLFDVLTQSIEAVCG